MLLGLTAAFGFVNYHWLRLPITIGLVMVALLASLTVMALDAALPDLTIAHDVRWLLSGIDFYETVMEGLLSFLLFAGALHVDVADLRLHRVSIVMMATVGVVLSTTLIGVGLHLITGLPLPVSLVFGALISPTDPVAVLGVLKTVDAPKALEVNIVGESLFNDGVGIVVFMIMTAIAFGTAGRGPDLAPIHILEIFAEEALGGGALGVLTGYLTYGLLRTVNDHNLEVIMTIALVMVTYAVGSAIGVSGPIAVVVAGLFIGNQGVRLGMSERTREHVLTFWGLIDEILNAVLFLLIGIESIALGLDARYAMAALLAIPLVLAARLVAVYVPLRLLPVGRRLGPGAVAAMTWGGMRGGISVALALSLPAGPDKDLILTATYAVVIFSIIVQGLTIRSVLRRFTGRSAAG